MFESIVVIVSFMVLIGSVIFFFNYIDSDDPPAQKPSKTKAEWATLIEKKRNEERSASDKAENHSS